MIIIDMRVRVADHDPLDFTIEAPFEAPGGQRDADIDFAAILQMVGEQLTRDWAAYRDSGFSLPTDWRSSAVLPETIQ